MAHRGEKSSDIPNIPAADVATLVLEGTEGLEETIERGFRLGKALWDVIRSINTNSQLQSPQSEVAGDDSVPSSERKITPDTSANLDVLVSPDASGLAGSEEWLNSAFGANLNLRVYEEELPPDLLQQERQAPLETVVIEIRPSERQPVASDEYPDGSYEAAYKENENFLSSCTTETVISILGVLATGPGNE